MVSARRVASAVCAVAVTSALAGPMAALVAASPASAQTSPGVTLPGATTTTPPSTAPPTTAPPSSPQTTSPSAPPTTRASAPPTTPSTTPGGKVPKVPVGGPPTTSAAPGVPAPPPPDPNPILTQVDSDLAQLNAIDDYKPAQALVTTAQAQVTAAGANLQSARRNLDSAKSAELRATGDKAAADAKLRSMALAAYIGVGYSTPGFGSPTSTGSPAGPGTVSSPAGLTGVQALDAKEMLILVGQKARRNDSSAARYLTDSQKTVQAATAAYAKAEAGVTAAEASLLSAQKTLKQVATAATTPGAAAATPLPNLASLSLASAALDGRPAASTPPAAPPAPGRAGTTAAIGSTPAAPASPDILGPSALTGSDLAAWFASTGRQADTTVPIAQLAADYQAWGQKTGVRYDLAFAQSVIETGYFSFPAGGQLTAKNNNFAGIGACDSCAHGWSFPDANTGVGAQLELLYEYASRTGLPKGLPNVIGAGGPGGCCQTWTQLAGVWASSTVYGISIMTVYHQMLTWLIPQRQIAAGLVAATTPAARGPELAPLPGAKTPAGTSSPAASSGATKAAATPKG